MRHATVLGSFISLGTYQGFINEIFDLVNRKISSYVCFANVHMAMEAYKDYEFQKILNGANIVAPDGKPISLYLNYFNRLKQERVCGMDIMPDLLKVAAHSGKSVYFYGTSNELLESIVHKAKKEFPTIIISGYHAPPFRLLSEEENNTIVEEIKSADPDLVFVALGCPKQEKWMALNKDKIGACLLGVGQAFRIYAGVERRTPKWMQNLSLEWLFRFYLEPRRLWKRYLYTNSHFMFLVFHRMIAILMHNVAAPFLRARSGSTLENSNRVQYRS